MHPRLELGIFCTESIRDSRCSTATSKLVAKYLYAFSKCEKPDAWVANLLAQHDLTPSAESPWAIVTQIYYLRCLRYTLKTKPRAAVTSNIQVNMKINLSVRLHLIDYNEILAFGCDCQGDDRVAAKLDGGESFLSEAVAQLLRSSSTKPLPLRSIDPHIVFASIS
ncbi:hypothetical protein EVAR_88895_1 [Eumeta japonica]|uniref:Uncharacterized protein n=1 Tax=Eumeta variegata TaxID=151549 RepID=A0A4C1XXJ7_EUMVA|nr:hypothetical protein EVAR_88895_1 [Eumeta japonica]